MRATAWLLVMVGCYDPAPWRPTICVCDAPLDSVSPPCDLAHQTGCLQAEKCTWIVDTTGPTYIGHIGCAPDGSAEVGAACAYGAAGRTGYDDCRRGAMCSAYPTPGRGSGTCEALCDPAANACGSGMRCAAMPQLLEIDGGTAEAGACIAGCDPLVDNDFLGSGVRGSGCAPGSGCYGTPASGSAMTSFSCLPDGDPALVHRSVVARPTVNSCAEGYLPLVHATTGSTTIVCAAMCSPADTSIDSPGAAAGVAPHRCASSDARGTFAASEQCMYLWRLEIDAQGTFLRSPYSDTLGVCIDHAQYRYDSNHDGVVDGSDATWPDCATLPPSGSHVVAADFGCVSTRIAPSLPAGPAPGL